MNNFKFFKPQSFKELLDIKDELLSAGYPLAGGSNLLVYIKENMVKSGTLIDISSIEELKGINKVDGSIEIGAAETITNILESSLINRELPFFSLSLKDFGNPLIRNKATIGGNLADASPVADTAPPLLVLGAFVSVVSRSGTRKIPVAELFTGPRKNKLEENEVIQKIIIPIPLEGKGAFLKLGQRKGTSISVTSVAVWIESSSDKFRNIKIALGGVAPTPVRALNTEKAFSGKNIDRNSIKTFAETLRKDIRPISDVRGSAEYRTEVSINLLKRAVYECLEMEE
ncbi:MAG: xanthine dehydrogenase family protein subunit M [Spirochaetes bacterium]|nr:MAG: xanthine dehydrogenase family protein subunit M [Spirochaetota bacterium]